MIARPATEPSRAAIKAAEAAASSPHALTNLVRLVKALEADEDDEVEAGSLTRKRVENVEYAEALLHALSKGNEQSSSTSKTLAELQQSLHQIRRDLRGNPQDKGAPFSPVESRGKPAENGAVATTTTGTAAPPTDHAPVAPSSTAAPVVRRRRKAPTIDEYLRQRAREDLASDESGLLPLKLAPNGAKGDDGVSSRDRLLGGASGGLGSAQLHEELGGQLADMSHRLKLNALHFAKSLEDEKDVLEIGQDVLEKNLAGTRSSKKDLSTVSSKSRGTTCMTLGIVLLVLVLFIWTYMLIRFT